MTLKTGSGPRAALDPNSAKNQKRPSASEPLLKHRNEKRMTSKPGQGCSAGENPAGACCLAG